jgi:hypothetical protein
LSSAGCSAIVDADKSKLGELPVPCVVGKTVSCPCPDGTTSTQVCNSFARYDPCMCQGHGGRAGQGGAAGRAGATGLAGTAGMAGRAGASGVAGRAGMGGASGRGASGRGAAGH